jgi:hypothetical protein
MSLVIIYRNPRRPEEGCMAMIANREQAEAMVKRLERQGFLVEKITFAPATKSAQAD